MIEAAVLLLCAIVLVNVYFFYSLHKLHGRLIALETLAPLSIKFPSVSIIVPIHNEEKKLREALTSMCQLDYPDFQVIAINDRSTDGSQAIITELQRRFSHLSSITVSHVPEGWLGKTHAMQKGWHLAKGELIVFTDADVLFSRTLLKKAVSLMVRDQLDHVTLAPHMLTYSFWMKLFIPFQIYSMMVSLRPWRLHNNHSKSAIGIGAFNLIRRTSLQNINGFYDQKLNPIDDMALARRLKQKGARQAFATPGDLLSIAWYHSLSEASIGLEKNILAFFDYSYLKALSVFLGYCVFVYAPFIGFMLPGLLGSFFSLTSIGFMLACLSPIYKQCKQSPMLAFLYPFTALLPLYMGLRSIFLAWKRGGIIWGQQFYTIQALRANHKKTH